MSNANIPASIIIRVISSINKIDAADWDRCAGIDHPFTRHTFLKALEDSGSVGEQAGWIPHHLLAWTEENILLGVTPAYLKMHSFGEYVFDHGWASAFECAGGRYYPKLQSAIPFTPVSGPRLLICPDLPSLYTQDQVAEALLTGLIQLTEQYGLSSLHITFPEQDEWKRCGARGLLQRLGRQYHWYNEAYADFEAFLLALSSRKRKQIRRERRIVAESGLQLCTLTGDDIKPYHWDAFYRFYTDTSARKWGEPYLKEAFFQQIGTSMPERIALVVVKEKERLIAAALNFIGNDCLYGRNWGCIAEYPFLHFEACYYRAIDFAIEQNLQRIEAGAQGEHKILRGYVPVETYSAHYIPNSGFRRAIENFLQQERQLVDQEIKTLTRHTPFRKGETNLLIES